MATLNYSEIYYLPDVEDNMFVSVHRKPMAEYLQKRAKSIFQNKEEDRLEWLADEAAWQILCVEEQRRKLHKQLTDTRNENNRLWVAISAMTLLLVLFIIVSCFM